MSRSAIAAVRALIAFGVLCAVGAPVVGDSLTDGAKAVERGETDLAVRLLQDAVKGPSGRVALWWLGRAYYEQAKKLDVSDPQQGVLLEKAYKCFKAVLADFRDDGWDKTARQYLYNIYVMWAVWLLEGPPKTRDSKKALDLCEEAVHLERLPSNPARAEAYYVMGKAARAVAKEATDAAKKTEAFEKAIRALNRVLGSKPQSDLVDKTRGQMAEVRLDCAQHLLVSGKLEEALAQIDQFLQLTPSGRGHFLRGRVFAARADATGQTPPAKSDWLAAIAEFQVSVGDGTSPWATDAARRWADAAVRCSVILSAQDKLDEAIDVLTAAAGKLTEAAGLQIATAEALVAKSKKLQNEKERGDKETRAVYYLELAMHYGSGEDKTRARKQRDDLLLASGVRAYDARDWELARVRFILAVQKIGDRTSHYWLGMTEYQAAQVTSGASRQADMDRAVSDLGKAFDKTLPGEISQSQADTANQALADVLVEQAAKPIDGRDYPEALRLLAEAEGKAPTSAASYWQGCVYQAQALAAGAPRQTKRELLKRAMECFQTAVKRSEGKTPVDRYAGLAQQAIVRLQESPLDMTRVAFLLPTKVPRGDNYARRALDALKLTGRDEQGLHFATVLDGEQLTDDTYDAALKANCGLLVRMSADDFKLESTDRTASVSVRYTVRLEAFDVDQQQQIGGNDQTTVEYKVESRGPQGQRQLSALQKVPQQVAGQVRAWIATRINAARGAGTTGATP